MKTEPIILVVDDEEAVLKLFQKILINKKYTVLTANNGKVALEHIKMEKPNLVVLDLKLPDMSGIDVLRQIKRINKNIEVIIITGYGAVKTARAAMRLGAYDYITKPFDNDYIKTLIEDALLTASGNFFQHAIDDKGVLNEMSNP